MTVEVKMPQMGESITEGTVVRWHKRPGDRVERDETLFEITTDKVDSEIPSPAAGWVESIYVDEGRTVPVDTPVCRLANAPPGAGGGETAATARASGGGEPAPSPAPREGEPAAGGAASSPAAGSFPSPSEAAAPGSDAPVVAEGPPRLSPAVRRLVREHGVDVAQIHGTGDGGRVTRRDVEEHLAARQTAGAGTAEGAGRMEPLSTMRRQIAEHLSRSVRSAVHATTFHEVDFHAVAAEREALRRKHDGRGERITWLPFVIQATALGLRDHPVLNAALRGDSIHYPDGIHLGVAVAIDDGLLVPVLRHADRLSVLEIAEAVRDLAGRARAGRLGPEEVRGGTFTVTNPGVFGSITGTPIIHQPQSAILCVGAVRKRAVVLSGTDAIAVRPVCMLSLTFDHRLIDGAIADRFASGVTRRIEEADFWIA